MLDKKKHVGDTLKCCHYVAWVWMAVIFVGSPKVRGLNHNLRWVTQAMKVEWVIFSHLKIEMIWLSSPVSFAVNDGKLLSVGTSMVLEQVVGIRLDQIW